MISGPTQGEALAPPQILEQKQKEEKRNTHFQIKGIFIRLADLAEASKLMIGPFRSYILIMVILTENDYLYKTQGHPATIFCEITVRRSKYCLEISKA